MAPLFSKCTEIQTLTATMLEFEVNGMKWHKQGVIFRAPGTPSWLTSHAAIPTPDVTTENAVTVYFSSRDPEGRAEIGRFHFTPTDPLGTLQLDPEPCIRLGPLGAYDDNGVTSACIVDHAGRKYQYYTGWSLGITVPFYFYIGLAISEDGGRNFEKASPAPVLGRDASDPYLTASPCVLIESGVWRMWYVSGVKWAMERGRAKHYYLIKYAESPDGIRWGSSRPVCIDFQSEDEYAIARPCVVKCQGGYRMWYCHRGLAYRLGYAESSDGISWERMDAHAGIQPGPDEWDSEMIAYPWVFGHRGTTYMLYNGNGYGRTGIGMAQCAERLA